MNPLGNLYGVGIRIIEDDTMVELVGEDWSCVRSPGRARRRRLKFRQNIRPIHRPKKHAYRMPDGRGGFVFVMHPATAAEFRRQLAAQARIAL